MRMIRLFSHYIPVNALLLLAIEAIVLFFSIYLGATLRFYSPDGSIPDSLGLLWPKAAIFTVVMLLVMTTLGLYKAELSEGLRGLMVRVVGAFVLGFGVMSLVFYMLPSVFLGRGLFGLAFFAALAGIILTRLVFFKWTHLGVFQPRVLVLGTGTRAGDVESIVRERTTSSVNVVGYLPLLGTHHHVAHSRILAPEDSLMSVVRKHNVNEIIIAVRDRRGGGLPVQELLECKLMGIKITELSTFFERQHGQIRLGSLNTSWMVLGEGFRQNIIREVTKRSLDLMVSALLLLITLPITLITALCIFVESGRPIFYRQQRVGQGGRYFNIFKFRSMGNGAEGDGKPRWATADDARTTRVGRIIRKLRIDELPQIFNVFEGDMSFVGPRPERSFFVEQLTSQIPYYSARHSIKPGITGWAQVRYPYGASLDDAIEKLQYDLYYVKNHTLFLDFIILIDTVHVVVWGKGAR